MNKKNKTVYDIAEEAEVSISTVSRVINDSAPVREETKKKVLAVIKKHNFQPNALARGLSKKSTKMLGIIMPNITNPFFSQVYIEAEKAALDLGYTMFLLNTMNKKDLESVYLNTLLEKQVDGIILMGGRIDLTDPPQEYIDEIKNIMEKVPLVMINGAMEAADCYRVRTNDGQEFKKGLDYLTSLGHKKIGFIGGTKGVCTTDEKLSVFKQEIKNVNIECDDEWIILNSYSIEAGIVAMEKLLECKEIPTAVVAVNDFVAIGAMKAAKNHGFRVPEDISVVGFDNIYLTEIFTPGLTTISHDYQKLGSLSVELLDEVNKGVSVKKENIVSGKFIERDSCKQT